MTKKFCASIWGHVHDILTIVTSSPAMGNPRLQISQLQARGLCLVRAY